MNNRDQSLLLQLHPEALFDAPYETRELDAKAYHPARGPWRIEPRANCAQLRSEDGAVLRVTAVADGILRVQAAREGTIPPSTTESLGLVTVPKDQVSHVAWRESRKNTRVRLAHGNLAFTLDTASGDWQVQREDGTVLCATRGGGIRWSDEPAEYGGERFLAAFDLPDGPLYGFGGRTAPFDRRGSTADMYAVKAGGYEGDYGGFPIPCFFSPQGYAVFLNNPWPHVYFDMGATDPDAWWVHAPGGECDWFIIDGPALPDVVRRFTSLVGRPPFPRRWWFGFWTSALAFGTAEQVTGVGRRLRDEGYPCDVLVIDGPWRAGPEFIKRYMETNTYAANDLDWHPEFGDGPDMVQANAAMGFKTVIHQNSRVWGGDTVRRGLEDGSLRMQEDECVVRVGTPEGDAFYAEALRPRHAEGIGTWWLDHADRVSGEVLPGLPSRNLFGAMWARLIAERMEADGLGRQIILARGAGIGGQRSVLAWPGDTRFGIDAFEEDLWFCLSAGLCGFAVTSFDLGGFMPTYDDDPGHNTAFDVDNLARRLCQGILFAPAPRMHQCDAAPPKLPWNCPPEIQQLYREMLVERYRLTPYIFSYGINAARSGEPIVRPLVYHFQDDPVVHTIGDQLLLGEWLLLAPVFQHGATRRRLYLPGGRWVCWWTGTACDGGQWIEVDAPLFERRGLPCFVRAGAMIPRMEPVDHLADEIPNTLTLDVFPSGSTEFACHESDAVTHRFRCVAQDGKVEITLPNHTTSTRRYLLWVRCGASPTSVICDGAAIDHTWDSEQLILSCHVDATADSSPILSLT